MEPKGRTASNEQALGHVCARRGALSKCYVCEAVRCNTTAPDGLCEMQVQGVPWEALPRNVPTVSDGPWAVGGAHRNDFGAATAVCVMLSGGPCVQPNATAAADLSGCAVRCWGHGPSYADGLGDHPLPSSAGWTVDPTRGLPQGRVYTVAGSGERGLHDGPAAEARFDRPQGVAADAAGNIYVADTFNHAVRMISAGTGAVTTVAGSGAPGYADGPLQQARFSHPSGIALWYNSSDGSPDAGQLVLVVADTDNHRIRLVRPAQGLVTTLAGRVGDPRSAPGYADGSPAEARFDHPFGVAVTRDGVVFVADTYNHLVRRVQPDGRTDTVAGTVEPAPPDVGCPPPCLRGVSGYADGPAASAKFRFPTGIALGPNGTVVVADGHRLRRVVPADAGVSRIGGVLSSNRVVTLAGTEEEGTRDGEGSFARFMEPRGVAVSEAGVAYLADAAACRLRRVKPVWQVGAAGAAGAGVWAGACVGFTSSSMSNRRLL